MVVTHELLLLLCLATCTRLEFTKQSSTKICNANDKPALTIGEWVEFAITLHIEHSKHTNVELKQYIISSSVFYYVKRFRVEVCQNTWVE